jgi:ribonuclease E
MRDALKIDRARVQVGRISRFGLLEMSRQRLRPSLGETSTIVCPRCSGQGTIRDTKSLALAVLRLLEEEAIKERSAEVRAVVPVPVATYLLNEKRGAITEIEELTKVRMVVLANPDMETPHFVVERLRDDQVTESSDLSFEIDTAPEEEEVPADVPVAVTQERAAVQGITPSQPAPEPAPAAEKPAPKKSQQRGRRSESQAPAKKPGLFARIAGFLSGGAAEEEPQEQKREPSRSKQSGDGDRGQRDRNRKRGGRGRGGRQRRDDETQQQGRRGRQKAAGQSEDKPDTRKREDQAAGPRDAGAGDEQRDSRGEGGRGRRRRGRGRDRDRDQRTEQTPAAESSASENSQEQGAKPRKRPADQRGADKPRRRRRGKHPADATEIAAANGDATTATGAVENAPVESVTADSPAASVAPADTPVEDVAAVESATMETAAVETAPTPASEEPSSTFTTEPDSAVAPEVSDAMVEPVSDEVEARSQEPGTLEDSAQEADAEVTVAVENEADEQEAAVSDVAQEPPTTSGGRVWNDPRTSPKPVDSVAIATDHPVFFRGDIAPPVIPVRPKPPRATNDPRGTQGKPITESLGMPDESGPAAH